MSPSIPRYRIADTHAHVYPPKIAAKATAAVGEFYGIPMANREGTSDVLLSQGAKIGVERYLVCSVATTVQQVEPISRFIAGECAAHPQFLGLGAYHVDVQDHEALLDQVEELGLKGLKIHPDFQRFDIDDPRMIPVYQSLVERDLVILIHMGDARYDYSAPRRLAAVLEQVPDLTVLAAHLGGHQAWDQAVEALQGAGANLYFDECSSLAFLEPEKARDIILRFGTDRVLFGVDFPMWDHAEELERFLALGLDEEANQDVLYNNFARLFRLEEG